MATSTQIKDNNDTLIRDKTAPSSITKVNVADQLDAIVDYVDQEVKAKVVKRVLTHNELLNIFTTPIVLLPATSEKAYIPKEIIVKYVNNDGWGSAGTWRVLLDTFQLTNFASQMGGTSTKEQGTYLLLGNPSNTTSSFFNKDVIVTSTANPTSPNNPNATAVIYMTYFEITE